MLSFLKANWLSTFAVLFFISYTFWWIFLQFVSRGSNLYQYDLFTVTYGLIAVWGGVWGIFAALEWGGIKSSMGKLILLLSFGLLAQEFGQLAYTYYIYIQGVEVPYPSIGDIGYFGSIPLYALGVLYMSKVSGVKLSLKSIFSKIVVLAVPVSILLFTYFFFLYGYEFDFSSPIRIFLDFGYPLGQAIYITIALLTFLLSRRFLGGVMKSKIVFILFALLVQYLADFSFLYQASRGEWLVSGVSDYIYFLAYFLMTIGILQLRNVVKKLKE